MRLLILSVLFLVASADAQIEEKIEPYLNTQLKNYDKIEFEILKTPSDYSSIKILSEKKLKVIGNYAYIPVEIVKKKKTSQSYITVKLKLYKNVLTAVRDIKAKEELTANDFTTGLQDVAAVKGKPVTEPDTVSFFRSKRNLHEGEILTENKIEKIPVIKIGSRVKASIVQGNVMIQTEAVSKQEGGAGDIIRIVTTDKKQFKAKVIDSNNVLITE